MKTVKELISELLIITLGVWIALLINNWNQVQDDSKFLKKIYQSINQEMEMNKEEFDLILPKQYALIDSISLFRKDKEVDLIQLIGKTNGLQIPTVKNTAWNSFLNTKLELVDFDIVSTLTDVEEGKKFMDIKFEKLMDFILSNTSSTKEKDKELLIIHLLNLIDTEEGLKKTYEEYFSWYAEETISD